MSEQSQTEHFAGDIDRLVDRYRDEYDISYAAITGVLQMKIHLLCAEAAERDDDPHPDKPGEDN